MHELVELLGDGRFDCRVNMPCIEDRDAAREVDVAGAFDVPELCVRRSFDVDGERIGNPSRDRGLATRVEISVRAQMMSP